MFTRKAPVSPKKRKDRRKSKRLYKEILKSYKNKYTLEELDAAAVVFQKYTRRRLTILRLKRNKFQLERDKIKQQYITWQKEYRAVQKLQAAVRGIQTRRQQKYARNHMKRWREKREKDRHDAMKRAELQRQKELEAEEARLQAERERNAAEALKLKKKKEKEAADAEKRRIAGILTIEEIDYIFDKDIEAGAFSELLLDYQRVVNSCKQTKHLLIEAKSLNRIGQLYTILDRHYEEAVKYHKKAHIKAIQSKEPNEEINCFKFIGNNLMLMHETSSAIENFKVGVEIAVKYHQSGTYIHCAQARRLLTSTLFR